VRSAPLAPPLQCGMPVPQHERARIAIIGAGPAGLSAARRLCDLGVDGVVVLEAEEAVGGKCCTVTLDGRAHDLGATMGVPNDYARIVEISDRAQIERQPFPREQCFDLATGTLERLNRAREVPRVLYELARYVWLHRRAWRGVDGRGLHHASETLLQPWDRFAERAGISTLSRRTLTYRTGYGYGYDDAVPAALHANLIRPSTIAGLARGRSFMWSTGTQPIWQALAAELVTRGVSVRTGARVAALRTHGGVDVELRDARGVRTLTVDRVIAACDPRLTASLMTPCGPERDVFAEATSLPYATFACRVSGMRGGDQASVGYLRANMQRGREGHPMAWVKRYADSDVYVFHLFAPRSLSDAEIASRIESDVRTLGGTRVDVLAQRRWSFFPHFPADAAQRGAYRKAEALQGARGVYFAGEFFSYATMARAAEHGEQIAERAVAGLDTTRIRSPRARAREEVRHAS
jgi:predicted NAD/FAD-dependent oxidoreductase